MGGITVTNKLVKSKAQFNRDELAGLLESIASRVREGTLTLGEGQGAVTLELPQVFTVEMEVQDSGLDRVKRELELEIAWAIDAEGSPLGDGGTTSGFVVS